MYRHSVYLTLLVRAQICKLQKRFTRFAAASDKVYQLFAQGWWFSPGTPASSTTKTGHHSNSNSKYAALRRKGKTSWTWNRDNVSQVERNVYPDYHFSELHCSIKNTAEHVDLVWNWHFHHVMEMYDLLAENVFT